MTDETEEPTEPKVQEDSGHYGIAGHLVRIKRVMYKSWLFIYPKGDSIESLIHAIVDLIEEAEGRGYKLLSAVETPHNYYAIIMRLPWHKRKDKRDKRESELVEKDD